MTSTCEKLAITASVEEIFTLIRMMADTCHGPHVVQCPHYFFAHLVEFSYSAERHQTLVKPVETDDVGLFDPRMMVYIQCEITGGHLIQVGIIKSVGHQDTETLQTECHGAGEAGEHPRYVFLLRGLGEHHHPCVNPFAAQCLHQTECHDGGTTESVAMID